MISRGGGLREWAHPQRDVTGAWPDDGTGVPGMRRASSLRRVVSFSTAMLLVTAMLPIAPAAAAEPSILYEQQRIVANTSSYSRFGDAVALWGNLALVGAPKDDLGYVTDAGSVTAFVRGPGGWSYRGQLAAGDGSGSWEFGNAIAIEGDTALIGASGYSTGPSTYNIGAVYVYTWNGTSWIQRARLVANEPVGHEHFGASVALDGGTALIGTASEINAPGAVYVFTGSGSTWTQRARLTVPDGEEADSFGGHVALDGGTALISASGRDLPGKTDAGMAYIFTGSGNSWTKRAELIASDAAAADRFGSSVALEGGTAVVSARHADTAAGENAGAAYVFTGSGSTWAQRRKITASGGAAQDQFGASVSLSGGTLLAGAPGQDYQGSGAGMAYVFTGAGSTWVQRKNPIAGDGAAGDSFGQAVAVSGGTALVGAPIHNWFESTYRGAAYVHSFATELTSGVTRIAGSSRYLTAVTASKRGFPIGAPAVVIATGENWPDALGGSALAGAARGPLLLTKKDSLPADVMAEIKRLGAVKAYVLGSTDAVSATVENALKTHLGSKNVKRLGGTDRYATARLVADETIALLGSTYSGRAFVATGLNYPDATAASPIAAGRGMPMLLANVRAGTVSLPVAVERVMILGSTSAVPAGVETWLEGQLGGTDKVDRKGGANRYDTAAQVAKWAVYTGLADWKTPGLSTGENFPDALASGPMLASHYGVLLLTRPAALPGETRAILADPNFQPRFVTLFIFGDTSAVSAAVEAEAKAAAGL